MPLPANGSLTTAPGTINGAKYWNWMPPNSIDLVQGDSGDVEQLPKGVAVELVNDSASTSFRGTDQYVHTGVILFDSTGKLLVSNIFIVPGTSLYSTIVPPTWLGTHFPLPKINAVNQQLFNSSVAVAIYDSSPIIDQPFYTTNSATTAADLNLQMTSGPPGGQTIPTPAIKTTQDQWVSNNAQLYFVSRTSGTLLKAE